MALKAVRSSRAWQMAMGLMVLAGACLASLCWWQIRAIDAMNGAIASGDVLPARNAPIAIGSAGSATAGDDTAAAVSAPASASTAAHATADWLTDGRPLEWRFAQAQKLAETGDLDGALSRFRTLYDDPHWGVAARYNSANALLRESIRLRGQDQREQAVVMTELAKEAYRGVLRRDPSHWDARYNLERAQRLQPDPSANDGEGVEPPGASERAATTMRGVSKGLP